MPADMGGKPPLRDGSNEESILAEIKQISSLLQFKTCAPALLTEAVEHFAIRHGHHDPVQAGPRVLRYFSVRIDQCLFACILDRARHVVGKRPGQDGVAVIERVQREDTRSM